MIEIIAGDCRDVLRTLPEQHFHTVVTSPPYFGLRDYGVDGQIGLEPTPDDFVAALVECFREVRRVLRDDGTVWLNLGDSYAANGGAHGGRADNQRGVGAKRTHDAGGGDQIARRPPSGLKQKDLIGIPWMVAFALRADGWYLRQDIIWSKPNPMPESVRDRCTKAHEYVFLLSKGPRYYFDAQAIKEPSRSKVQLRRRPNGVSVEQQGKRIGGDNITANCGVSDKRNRRSVWSITPRSYKGAHFATFPVGLAEICIQAGAPEGGYVLDPFSGAGTTGLAADQLRRNGTLIDLNPAYIELTQERLASAGCEVKLKE